MEQLIAIEQCIDELEQGVAQNVALDRQQLALAIKRLQALLARSAPSIDEIVPIQPLPGDPELRLSKRLQLECAYDSSNSKMSLSILVCKALENYRFNDLLTLAQYIGVDQLKKTADTLYGKDVPKRLKQILRNIESGLMGVVRDME